MRNFLAVTTFNKEGLDLYGHNFINSFIKNMPKEVRLVIYAEGCFLEVPGSDNDRIIILDAKEELTKLNRFKKRYKNVPMANGYPDETSYSFFQRFLAIFKKNKFHIADEESRFKWDAIRFSHKVYAIFDAAKRFKADTLIWMDADTYVHTKVPFDFIDNLVEEDKFLSFLGRQEMYTECGWYSINLKHKHSSEFLQRFEDMYENAKNGIFKLREWHDSFVFDHVRLWHEKQFGVKNKNISEGDAFKTSHPLINSSLGQYFDHLKGKRKYLGSSKKNDLKISHGEGYWSSQDDTFDLDFSKKLKIGVFLPQLDMPFKKPKGEQSKEMKEKRKKGDTGAVRVYWKEFVEEIVKKYNEAGHDAQLIVKPMWEITPKHVNEYNLDLALIPHKQKSQFHGLNCHSLFYMQVIFRWLFSIDSLGWSAGNSLYPNDYSQGDENKDTYDKYRDKLIEGNVSKFSQSDNKNRLQLIKDGEIPDSKYIFFPCQIPHDQSIQLFSDLEEISVIRSLVKWSKKSKIPIVFKSHPANPKSCEIFKDIAKGKNFYWSSSSIHDLISNSEAVYTINSGVGLEAMFYNKPIVTFGRAEYDAVTIHYEFNNLRNIWNLVLADDPEVRLRKYRKFVDWYCRLFCVDLESKNLKKILESKNFI